MLKDILQEGHTSQAPCEKCSECGSTNIIHDKNTGETICGSCGLVVRDRDLQPIKPLREEMEETKTWRPKTPQEKLGVRKLRRAKRIASWKSRKERRIEKIEKEFTKSCK